MGKVLKIDFEKDKKPRTEILEADRDAQELYEIAKAYIIDGAIDFDEMMALIGWYTVDVEKDTNVQ